MCHHEVGAKVGTIKIHMKILALSESNSEIDFTFH